jgi:CheY-like chemotaxis protein
MRSLPQSTNRRFLPPDSLPLLALNDDLLPPLKEHVAEPLRPTKEDGSRTQEAPQGHTILVVDDSPFERTVIRSAVEGMTHFQVCGEASDGVEGIEKALELKPDLVIMDLAMPLMNGVEAAMVLRNSLPKVPIVLFTLYAEQLRGSISPGLGVTIILSKADGLGPLLECLEQLLPT